MSEREIMEARGKERAERCEREMCRAGAAGSQATADKIKALLRAGGAEQGQTVCVERRSRMLGADSGME